MLVAAVVTLGVLVAVALGVTVPWRLALSVQAHGDPGGAWAVAGGAQLFACAASVAQARGTPLVVELRAFGRRVLLRKLGPRPAPKPAPAGGGDRLRRLARRVDPVELVLFLAGERRRVAVRDLDASVDLALHDVALAGQVAGALAVLSALGSPFGRLRHRIDWAGPEHLDASVSLSLRFSPALLACDTLRFAARSLTAPTREPPWPTSSPAS
jgi:hypothetical protein